jgi:hypothetical protein
MMKDEQGISLDDYLQSCGGAICKLDDKDLDARTRSLICAELDKIKRSRNRIQLIIADFIWQKTFDNLFRRYEREEQWTNTVTEK